MRVMVGDASSKNTVDAGLVFISKIIFQIHQNRTLYNMILLFDRSYTADGFLRQYNSLAKLYFCCLLLGGRWLVMCLSVKATADLGYYLVYVFL